MAQKKLSGQFDYDLIVIGSGAGGSVAAHLAKKAGQSVAIVEADLVGGECPNVGCVPTKALLQAAEIYQAAKQAGRFGIRGGTVGYNYPSIKAWKDLAVKRTGTYLGEEIYSKDGINLLTGRAFFIDPHTISIGSARFSARNFLIATGSELVIPPIPGLSNSGYLTYKEAINLTRPPRRLAIIGGGAIGCEFSQLFATFGSKVHLIDTAPRLLAKEEPEASALIAQQLRSELGVEVVLDSIVEQVEKIGAAKRLTLKTKKGKRSLLVDEILVATGKKAVVDIGLENAGVRYDAHHIKVNQYLQTSNPQIFAAGDCVGPYLFTHVATYQSRVAAHNLLHPRKPISADYSAIPRCIFTSPEVAAVGKTEQELVAEDRSYHQATVSIAVIGRANTADVSQGFVKVLASARSGVLLGATVVSPHAGEIIHELTLAVQHKLTASQVANTIHAFPTWSESVRVACSKLANAK